VRLGISEFFEMLETSQQNPTETNNNLKRIMAAVKGTESFSKSFIEVFERVTSGSNTWNEVKAHLQLVTSFSFLGAYAATSEKPAPPQAITPVTVQVPNGNNPVSH
jgi:hypothetical protein